jgi:hypothetical protein
MLLGYSRGTRAVLTGSQLGVLIREGLEVPAALLVMLLQKVLVMP